MFMRVLIRRRFLSLLPLREGGNGDHAPTSTAANEIESQIVERNVGGLRAPGNAAPRAAESRTPTCGARHLTMPAHDLPSCRPHATGLVRVQASELSKDDNTRCSDDRSGCVPRQRDTTAADRLGPIDRAPRKDCDALAELGGGCRILCRGPGGRARRTRLDRREGILRGADPATLPVEQSTAYELTVNLGTAKALHVDMPNAMIARADAVIE
jgi:hypothetical protein